jgi:hypothetical protein
MESGTSAWEYKSGRHREPPPQKKKTSCFDLCFRFPFCRIHFDHRVLYSELYHLHTQSPTTMTRRVLKSGCNSRTRINPMPKIMLTAELKLQKNIRKFSHSAPPFRSNPELPVVLPIFDLFARVTTIDRVCYPASKDWANMRFRLGRSDLSLSCECFTRCGAIGFRSHALTGIFASYFILVYEHPADGTLTERTWGGYSNSEKFYY